MKIGEDLFIIPEGEGGLVYAPLRRVLFWANHDACENIISWASGSRDIGAIQNKEIEHLKYIESIEIKPPQEKKLEHRGRLIIIPSQICNFACKYCYARNAHSKDVISHEQLIKAIDIILNDQTTTKKHFTFIGGGEPFMTWDIVTESVEYIKSQKKDTDNVSYGITTNGTLFNKERIEYCKENKIRINLSFEVLKDIQDAQRPFSRSNLSTFEVIDRNLKELINHNIPCNIRSTITSRNVDRMTEMVDFVVSNYTGVKGLHLEQVTDPEEDSSEFYNKFIQNFFEAKKISQLHGIRLTNSIANSIDSLKERFCSGEFCLTPKGTIVACHRVSSEKDTGYELFKYGQIDDNGFNIDHEQEVRYLKFSSMKQRECHSCFAYWHCAGICPMERISLSDEHVKNKCNFAREMIKRELLYRLTIKQ